MGVVLVTGSSGLLGSECVRHFDRLGCRTVGVDSGARKDFFGPGGDTRANLRRLHQETERFEHVQLDVREQERLADLVAASRPEVVIHCAAQPSHDWATQNPVTDFDVNALGTLNLLEAVRRHAPEAAFCFASTNKVYGDSCNRLPLVEGATRFDFAPNTPAGRWGLGEWLSVDDSRHSVFGVSKLAADVLTQEYARTYGLKTGVFRLGCVTGAAHAGVPLHGFLAYLARCCKEGARYVVLGHKGKQVRDQIHAADVASAFAAFARDPRPGGVYNLGGGMDNSVSVLDAIDRVQEASGKPLEWEYVDVPRGGDHVCWVTDTARFRAHYPGWGVTRDLKSVFEELCRP